MAISASARPRVTVDGKFFRLGARKFYVKGVAYGPFAPDAEGLGFASREQTAADFSQIRELGANTVRIYQVPPRWLLDLALEHDLKVFVDVPWSKHQCFLDSEKLKQAARDAVRQAATACAGHPAVFALSVVNEIPADVVRWSGAAAVERFVDELIELAKAVDPECLCTFASFPPTEFLHPQNPDFITFNVYLHQQRPFENYLFRLQALADSKPVMLGECGIDSIREGEAHKCEILHWQIEAAFRGGLAGTVVYSFTDDWFKDGRQIEDWAFGLTRRNRKPKDSYFVVQQQFRAAPYFPLARTPRVSVVVASYNGGRTLKACLDSLERLNYPDYEVILVDDGSTDTTPQIASLYPTVRYLRQPNFGLSVARNTGIHAATGEIVAFTDSDCRADEDWLYYLVADLLNSRYAGMGGHNFLPPEDSPLAAAVLVSPGGPAHVMLTDRLAEHIPGCNMAFYRSALLEIGGFDPIFRKAGDDVDVCWRLQQRGYRIGFSHAGFVWHYRRSTVRAYLKQQGGYGEAEALLVRKHPEYFNAVGGSIWHGRIYTASKFAVETGRPMIYHGLFGSAFFQSLYRPPANMTLMLLTSLEYHVLVTIPLLVLGVVFPWLLPLGLTSMAVSGALCVTAAAQADLPRKQRRFWSKPLVALLFLLQPIVRGWARYRGRLNLHQMPPRASLQLARLKRERPRGEPGTVQYWADGGVDRFAFLGAVLERLDKEGWQNKADTGWSEFDVEIFGSRWSRLQLTTVCESFPRGMLVRCRLRTAWSLLAKIAFWSALGFELLVIGVVRAEVPWIWFLLLFQLAFAAFLHNEERNLQLLIGQFLDELAESLKLVKLDLPQTVKLATRPD
jgi:glycosyltransferase involved in cell wall biosynthesis